MREKELRLALICYGGISLAVYMHGITREIWKLLKASRAVEANEPAPEGDSERVYYDLLKSLRPGVNLKVSVDIIAGASAGGINGILLGEAISSGASLDPLVDLWLDKADVDELLDPDAVPKSAFTKFYAAPLLRLLAKDRSIDLTKEVVEAGARRELREKLSRFVRSRWFKPPFSGARFSGFILDAFEAMHAGPHTPPLLPEGSPLDLFVTVTDFYGHDQVLTLHSPPVVREIEHRKVIAFRDRGRNVVRSLASSQSLASAARATASFPGAFPPFQAAEMDELLERRNQNWPDRGAFLANVFPERAGEEDLDLVPLLDGSILNNAPFRPALAALKNRTAYREVDRRFVYIDPKPGIRSIGVSRGQTEGPPGFFTTIIQSLSDIPREQPIRDDLEALDRRSQRVRKLRSVLDGIADDTDAAINSALGSRTMNAKPSAARLETLRAQATAAAVEKAGLAYSPYAHLKLAEVTAFLERIMVQLARPDSAAGEADVRARIREWRRDEGIEDITRTVRAKDAARDRFVRFLRAFDLSYRIRRLRYVVRKLNELTAEDEAREVMASAERARGALFEMLGPFLDRETVEFAEDTVADWNGLLANEPAEAIARYRAELDLAKLDTEIDRRISVLIRAPATMPVVRRAILRAYLGFPLYDMATFPLLQGEGLDEYGEVRIDRISPEDAHFLRSGGTEATLKGIRFNSFGAFFSRAYRENDYLWGRLHGAERMIEIVLSALSASEQPAGHEVTETKRACLSAILDTEADHLGKVSDLIEQLRGEL
ncbi:patatin [Pacificimonas flava]|uniref:Patatin n=2 Tax=Pacificimonas TaxID=1960290 RepID=A0A219B5E9_9SPHN|nr:MULTISPECIES: patatin-like protein [Pacificimonas]MBZ6377268.1 patatin-like protein [Pacificimonas aurantium]OWV33019.1 patatin [Pacificimonas flava]